MSAANATADAWVLSTDEFRLLWEAFDSAAYPRGFALGGGVTYSNGETQLRVEKETRERFRAQVTGPQRAAITALMTPRYAIGILGAWAPGDGVPVIPVHVHSGWDGSSPHVYVAVQQPGPDDSTGGPVHIHQVGFVSWSQFLVARLPASTGPGARPADHQVPMVVERVFEVSTHEVAQHASSSTAAAAFGRVPLRGGAVVSIKVGPEHDQRKPVTAQVHVSDVPEDGRYALALVGGADGAAMGVTDVALTKLINRVVNATRRQYDSQFGEA